jgi:hypothetical protein
MPLGVFLWFYKSFLNINFLPFLGDKNYVSNTCNMKKFQQEGKFLYFYAYTWSFKLTKLRLNNKINVKKIVERSAHNGEKFY